MVNTLILKQHIQILCLILLVSTVLGCINTNSENNSTNFSDIKPGFGVAGDSEFETGPGWYQKHDSKYADFNYNGSTENFVVLMRVHVYPNQSEFNKGTQVISQNSMFYVVSSESKTIENITVKMVKTSRLDDSETVTYYFFEKEGRYYQILIDVAGRGAMQYFNNNQDLFDRTVNTILRTIH